MRGHPVVAASGAGRGVRERAHLRRQDLHVGALPHEERGADRAVRAGGIGGVDQVSAEGGQARKRVEGDHAEVWTGVQDPLNARSVAAKALRLSVENVHLTNFMLGGGFGRRLPFTFDYVDLAARVAKEMSPVPVKTIWTRENDIQHDYYRPAGLSRHAGALANLGPERALGELLAAAAALPVVGDPPVQVDELTDVDETRDLAEARSSKFKFWS